MAPQRTLLLALFLLFSSVAWNREHASTFARLPSDRQNPEGIAVDHAGNVYVADFEVKGSPPGHIVVFDDRSGRFLRDMAIPGSSNLLLGLLFQASTGRLLATTGVPPFGANGLAFNRAETFLFVANTGNDAIVRIANAGATGGPADVLTYSINGADGLAIDEHDNLWVCANQSDEIVVVDP